MGRKKPKKRKKEEEEEDLSDSGESSSPCDEPKDDKDKYKPFQVPDYVRYYPVDGGKLDYIVYFESSDTGKALGDRDMMALANCLKRFNKGIKQLRRINKYKIGVVFERPGLANAALSNKTFLDSYKLKATIPATATEVTGVIQHVPLDLSNEQIYSNISCSKNIVSVRRFMKRTINNNTVEFQPLKTVSITFSCPSLPDSVDLNSWRFEVRPYIAPVKQCLRCLRYGHIAKFCKNAEKCSICSGSHNFKSCTVDAADASCCHCKGNHIAISPDCPVKKEKINQNKMKLDKKTFAETLEKSFPPLISKSPSDQLALLLNSEHIMNIIVGSVTKLLTQNKTNELSINSQNIKTILLETLSKSN